MKHLLITSAAAIFLICAGQAAEENSALKLFQQSCIKCHGKEGKVKGKVNLLKIRSAADLTSDLELLHTIIEMLDKREMPPEKEPALKPKDLALAIQELQQLLHAAAATNKEFAATPIRRMNRFQYNNAVQDLFQLNVSVFALPERMMRDRSGYFRAEMKKMPDSVTVSSRQLGKSALIEPRLAGVGPFPQDLRAENSFDNRGDHLSLSPMLMEAFFKLSRRIVQSPNFDESTIGIWQTFFKPPQNETDLDSVIRERLRGFLTKAFRRPIKEGLLDRYVRHVSAQIKLGLGFTDSMKEAASAVLSSPRFLYLYDQSGSTNEIEKLDGYELASRLSFFLWGSIPDDELLRVAGNGRLSEPKMLEQQVNRMLANPKLKRFCDSFPTQWLQLERIVSSLPDEKIYADFYYAAPNYRTSMDMMMEPLLLFETILIENRSILELIDSEFTYRSARLRNWYGEQPNGKIGGPVTMQFKRQRLTDRRQGGVITTAAVMTMTSGPDQTKPITRGAWVSAVIFNAPPEAPPANVPELSKQELNGKKLTLRERFAAHRERADCAGCHAKIDPLGFALENFDPVGRWRDRYEDGQEVNPAGVLFQKHSFNDVLELKDAILAEKDRFTRAFASHMLSYALGRKITATDTPALERIVSNTVDTDYNMQKLIHEVTQSAPFISRASAAPMKPVKMNKKTSLK